MVYNLVKQIPQLIIRKPEGYSVMMIEEIEDDIEINYVEANGNRKPDIIVIMDESFADLEVLGSEINTNIEVTPFMSALRNNTVSGYALASVYGGNTPNSEFEFLFGDSCAFLPSGAIPYQQYIDNKNYSMVSVLKNQGYKCIAMHPYLANGWQRERVYPLLGFDDVLFLDDFPQQDMVRNYVSDQEMFETLLHRYEKEKQQSDKPLFFFGVTMQNHGSYEYNGDDFENTVVVEGLSKDYKDANQYLSLIHATDCAMEFLIRYLEENDRDVIVVFFGDHQPRLDEQFCMEIHGGTFDTFDEQMLQYEIPFWIWTNYETPEERIELTSINYLGRYLLEAAKISLPPYSRFLENAERIITSINARAYYSETNSSFLECSQAVGEELEVIQEYRALGYNHLFDEDNRSEFFFPELY